MCGVPKSISNYRSRGGEFRILWKKLIYETFSAITKELGSARKAQLLASEYKKKGGGYK
jgi:hypothetical protein